MFFKLPKIQRLKTKLKVLQAEHEELKAILEHADGIPRNLVERRISYAGKIASLKCKIEKIEKP